MTFIPRDLATPTRGYDMSATNGKETKNPARTINMMRKQTIDPTSTDVCPATAASGTTSCERANYQDVVLKELNI